jgi:hypothetical protein
MMVRYRNKILPALLIAAILAAAWGFGGNFAKPGGGDGAEAPPPESALAATPSAASPNTAATDTATPGEALPVSEAPGETAAPAPGERPEAAPPPAVTDTKGETPPPAPEAAPAEEADPAGPLPADPPATEKGETPAVGGGSFTVTLCVRCDTLLDKMDLLDGNKRELVPADGVLFPATAVTAYEGESVFNVLQREMKRAKIHFEFMNTPLYHAAYLEGIGNLYEFDAGDLSGWLYRVDGWYPNYGCSRYPLRGGGGGGAGLHL